MAKSTGLLTQETSTNDIKTRAHISLKDRRIFSMVYFSERVRYTLYNALEEFDGLQHICIMCM